jgi:hypothetical protein
MAALPELAPSDQSVTVRARTGYGDVVVRRS